MDEYMLIDEGECLGCGYVNCSCEAMLEAHYELCPDDEPIACGMCSNIYPRGAMEHGELCERCARERYDDGY